MPLSDTAVRNAKPRTKPFKLSDGGGLHLLARLQAFRRAPAPVERRVCCRSEPRLSFPTFRVLAQVHYIR